MKPRLLLLVTALGMGACAKQGAVRTQYPDPPVPDLYHLCSDVRFHSMCTAVPDEQPVRIDTNLTSPRAQTTSAG